MVTLTSSVAKSNLTIFIHYFKNIFPVLAGVAPWSERWPENQRVAGSIPGQGTCLDCGQGPQLGACERQPHIDVSLPLSPSL